MRRYILYILSVVVLLASCGPQQGAEGVGERKQFRFLQNQAEEERLQNHAHPKLILESNGRSLGEIEVFYIDEVKYVPVVHTLQLLDFHVEEDHGRIKAGFTDKFIDLKNNSNQATIEEIAATLPMKLTTRERHEIIAVPSLKELLGTNAQVGTVNGKLVIKTEQDVQQFGFFNNGSEVLDLLPVEHEPNQQTNEREDSSVTAKAIINEAKKHLGVPYEFDAKADQANTFDSSSFVQYVFKKNEIELPGVARNQAKLGTPVSVQDLMPGDLLFFYWPGRNDSNRIVGHVGIYMGNGQMIHSSPNANNGVQIENLKDPNSTFRDLFLGAKRFAE